MKSALVVDDTKNIRILLSKTLELEGFKVYSAKDAFEALSLIHDFSFDIGFIDVKMPRMSGTDLLEEIHHRNLAFPIVIMTAFGTIKNAVKTTKLGANFYLQKPFSALTIKKTLEDVLGPTYDSKPLSLNIDSKTLDILSDAPLNSASYLKVSEFLNVIEEPHLSKLFKDFSLKLLDYERTLYE